MTRLFRALWTDKSLLLLLVPAALLLSAIAVNRSAADEIERTSATSSTTTTVAPAGSEGAAGQEVPQVTVAAADEGVGFDSGGRTITDDSGNLVRVPNDVSYGSSAGLSASVAGATQTADDPGATPATVAGVTTTPVAGATTTTLPGTTTTTTLPVDPTPVVSESPLTILLPVSGILVVGIGWIAVSVRRRSRNKSIPA